MRAARFLHVLGGAFFLLCALLTPAHAGKNAAVRVSSFETGGAYNVFFDWANETSFTEKFDGDTYVLTFSTSVAAADLPVAKVLPALPEKLKDWHVSRGENNLVLQIKLPETYTAFTEKDGLRTTVVLKKGERSQTPPEKTEELKTQQDPPATAEKTAPEPETKPSVTGPAPVETEKTDENVKTESVVLPSEDSETVARKKEEIANQLFASFAPEERETSVKGLSLPRGFQQEKQNTSVEESFSASDEGGYRIATFSFPWPKMTALAAFRRDGYLWLVFDRKGEFDFKTERTIYRDIVYEMVEIPHSHGTIFRFVVADGYNPSFRREGMLWVMDLMYQPLRPRSSVELVLQRKTPFGPRLFIPLAETPKVIPVLDPEVGDVIFVVPLFSLNKGMGQARSFVDLDLLRTAQGLVVIPKSDEVSTYTSSAGLEIRGPQGGMRLSSQDVFSFLTKKKVADNPMEQMLDVGVWSSDVDGQEYFAQAQQLQEDVLKASKEEKPVKRLILARYYFANGMYPETLGILSAIQRDTPEFFKNAPVLALYGAVNYMLYRYNEALKTFAAPELRFSSAVDFWRAATQVAIAPKPEIFLDKMKRNMGILQAYPAGIKTRLGLAGMRAAVAGRDEMAVQNFFEISSNPKNTPAQEAEIDYWSALWQEHLGQYHQAHKTMIKLTEGKDLYFRAFAGLEKSRLDAKLQRATVQERIQDLEQLLFAWRDGDFQYNLMTQLIAAYEEQKDYAHVLYLLKEMQLRYRDKKETKNIPDLMEEVFQKLYLDDEGIRSLSPIRAIAVYNEFHDLAPKGKKGVLIARKLSDRLTSIDLLDKAAELLEEQMRQKLSKEEKSTIGTRLALVYLLNKMPEKSIQALERSEVQKTDAAIAAQRRYIKATALKNAGKTAEAMDVLKNDTSYESILLQAEICWEAKEWDKVADLFKMLIKRPVRGVPLTDREARAVLDWATALRLAERPKVLMRLRENFMPFMKTTPYAESFDFITQVPAKGIIDYKTIPAQINMAERFSKAFKDHLDFLKKEAAFDEKEEEKPPTD